MNSITQSNQQQAPSAANHQFEDSMAHIRSLLELVSQTALDTEAREQGRLLTLVHCIERELNALESPYLEPNARH